MTAPRDISGLIVAVLTPFDPHGRIDAAALQRHLEFLEEQGVGRILVNGTTGEFFSLTIQERRTVLRICTEVFGGQVLCQTGCDSCAQTVEESLYARDLGVDAILALPPYYWAQAPQSGIVAAYNHLADRVDLPLILYNFPRHTQNPLTADMLDDIRHWGLKDSSADLNLIRHTPRYFVGSDDMIVRTFDAGGCGVVSARANFRPQLYTALEQAWRSGARDTMLRMQEQITTLKKTFSGPGQIARIKYALGHVLPDYPPGLRLPLVDADATDRLVVETFLHDEEASRGT